MIYHRNVMVYGEIVEGQLSGITKELIGGARLLTDELGEELIVVFIGNGVTEPGCEAFAFGANRVFVMDNPTVKDIASNSLIIQV